jgi:hypothetical protein
MAPILRRAPLRGESDRSVFEIVTLLCRRETIKARIVPMGKFEIPARYFGITPAPIA